MESDKRWQRTFIDLKRLHCYSLIFLVIWAGQTIFDNLHLFDLRLGQVLVLPHEFRGLIVHIHCEFKILEFVVLNIAYLALDDLHSQVFFLSRLDSVFGRFE